MPTIKDVKCPPITEGVIRSAQIYDTAAPENSVQLAVNMNFDSIGAMQTRPGVTSYGHDLGGSVKSFGVLNVLGGVKKIFGQVGTDVSVYTGSAWTSVRTLTKTNKARYSQWLNNLWMVNGNDGDAVMLSSGSTFTATGVPAGFPKGDFIQAGFDGRVWVGDASKDVLYYTDIVQFNGTSGTYEPLTFTLADNFIEKFSSQNGESMTGLIRVPRALLVFKQNHIYRVYSTENVDPYPAYNVGTYSQESIVETKQGVFFHHSSGFYQFNYDGQPTEISRRIVDFVRAIPRANYGDITGIYDGYDSVKWNIGAVTVEGISYTNCQVRYTISTQVWTIYDYTPVITAMIRFDDGTTIEQVCGTSTGVFAKLDLGNTDLTLPIYYEMIDRWRSFTEMYYKSKEISGLMVMSQNAAGAELQYQTEKSPVDKWEDIDKLDDRYDSLMPNAKAGDFNSIRFRIKGFTKGEPVIIYGTELLSIQIKGQDSN